MATPGMAELAAVGRRQSPRFQAIYMRRFFTGLWTNRSPLLPPGNRYSSRFLGPQNDALLDGLNIELTNSGLLQRRPGFVAYSSATLPKPAQAFFGWRNTSEALYLIADTPDGIYSLSPTAVTEVLAKSSSTQVEFLSVGDWCYFGNGTDIGKWNGAVAEKWGIAAPASAPTLSFASAGAVWAAGTPYAVGDEITDPYQNTQKCTTAGTSGANVPTWQLGPGQTTSDGTTVVWTNQGLNSSAGVFEQRGCSYGYCYLNSTTGHYSTMSPSSANTGQQANQKITIKGAYSTDAQVDKVAIFRTPDGGSTWLYLAEVDNDDSGGTWSYADTSPDSSLNELIAAPVAGANDPPPDGLHAPAYHAGRVWGAVANSVYYSGGPDTVVGSGNEAWPAANVFTFPAAVKRLVPYSGGLYVFTTDALYVIRGVDSTSFYVQLYQGSFGISSYNALSTLGSTVYCFTSDRQLCSLSSSGIVEVGFPIGNLLEAVDPTKVYVAVHIAGSSDKAVYVSDGSSTIYRCNPNQQPEGTVAWSAKSQPVGGVGAIASVETDVGNWNLLMSAPTGTDVPILGRSLSTFTDNESTYDAWLVQGSIMLASPGQLAAVQFLALESANVGTAPTIGVLFDEISGDFSGLDDSVNEPPALPASTSIRAQRFYCSQGTDPIVCRHLQAKVTFAAESTQDQLLSLAIYGAQLPA